MRRFLIFLCRFIKWLMGCWAFELEFGMPKIYAIKWAWDKAKSEVYK